MIDVPSDVYLLVKAFHIVSVIAWMAGLLYLPRLYVYHCEADKGSELSEKLKVMERRLFNLIMRPARIFTLLFGVILLLDMDLDNWFDIWVVWKLIFVFFLFGAHDMMGKWRKSFDLDLNTHSQKFYRIVNEVPTALMIMIVCLVVFKPV